MAAPSPPELKPFLPCMGVNMMALGHYDITLKKIMQYFADLGSYIDSQDSDLQTLIDAVSSRVDTVESTLTNLDSRITYIEENPYILPHATPEVLGGVYTVTDEDFLAYLGIG